METMFADLTPEERVKKMDELCHHKGLETFDKPLTPEQVAEVKDIITDRAGKMAALTEEKKAFMDGHNAEFKPLKEEFDIKVNEARSGTRNTEGQLWYMDDQEAGVMNLVDETGATISTRPLRRDERDANIFKMGATGTEG